MRLLPASDNLDQSQALELVLTGWYNSLSVDGCQHFPEEKLKFKFALISKRV
jgi:hypothetical protein